MLLGELKTPVQKIYQKNAFDIEKVDAFYMQVSVTRHVLGERASTFDVRFGNIILENNVERFDIIFRHPLELTAEEIETWGTDDSELINIISNKLNVEIAKIVSKDIYVTY